MSAVFRGEAEGRRPGVLPEARETDDGSTATDDQSEGKHVKNIDSELEKIMPGRWLTLEQIAVSTRSTTSYIRQRLLAHPLADWRPLYGQHRSAGAPVKEWTIQTLRKAGK
jgi:hypothetical protein